MDQSTNRNDFEEIPEEKKSEKYEEISKQSPPASDNEDEYEQPRSGVTSRSGSSKSLRGSARRIRKPKDLEERKQALNELFGFKPFVGHITKRKLEERSELVRSLYETQRTQKPIFEKESFVTVGNVFYVILFGWWVSLTYIFVGCLLCLTFFGIPYGKWAFQLAKYFVWPFGKFITRKTSSDENISLLPRTNPNNAVKETTSKNNSNIQEKIGFVFWIIFAVPFLFLAHCWACLWSWLLVVFVPTSKINRVALRILFQSPLKLSVSKSYPTASADVILFTYNSVNLFYYKYTLFGVNIILLNLFPIVFLTLIIGYAIPKEDRPNPAVIFSGALISIVPLAYMIGMAVSSISAQSSLALGAFLNALFGSVVELILYWTAIATGGLGEFVQASITGSLLCTLLLIPGTSMVFAGLKYKEMRFNQLSAGVSSVLLIISIIGAFLPTIYYTALGSYSLQCDSCVSFPQNNTQPLICSNCTYRETDLANDRRFLEGARPLMYGVSIVLPLAYFVGLLFTLKTHAALISNDSPKSSEGEGHDSPEWGKIVCIIVLVFCTALFAGISDLLAESVQELNSNGISQGFLGVFFIGIFGNAAELINAVSFGLRDNIALSLEIGYAGTIQTALIQIPGLVFFSAIINHGNPIHSFLLIFPTLNLFAIIFSVLIVNYISINGRTNYFEGSSLLLVYAVLITAFYFVPDQ